MSDTTESPYIIEATESSFERDAIERSRDVPVVVDFWATWCQPCRLLGPILEKLAREADGAFVLVKAETERLAGVAASFGVRSIPAVFAIRDGQIVDSFLGLLPESSIRSWLARLMPTPAERKVAEARRAEADDPDAAARLYREALELAPTAAEARIGLARVLLSQGRDEDAGSQVAALEARGFLEPEAERIKAELALHAGAKDAGDLDARRAEAAANPEDLSVRFKLAEALAAIGQQAEALELALSVVERGPKDLRESARRLMISIFQVLPDDSEMVGEYRRQLSAALY